MTERAYIAIDLKSFYASVECAERDLDALTTNLVVADASRTSKTICLAVSPSLKSYGIPGRPRLFEVEQKIAEVNMLRRQALGRRALSGTSCDKTELDKNPTLAVDYHVVPPQMAHYLRKSAEIYAIYLNYVAEEDIFPYSIDEVFIDATPYLGTYGCTAQELAVRMMREVLEKTKITATAGIGSNLYLAKIAMDVKAKRTVPDANGVRIATLDEESYRREFWNYRPLTDFWCVGRGIASKLEAHGMHTMGDIARCSVRNEEILFRLFGVNAELLIDHAWGWEPTELAAIKSYRPETHSIHSGQVLQEPYPYDKARLVVKEMSDLLSLDLVDKGLVTDQLVLEIGYDVSNVQQGYRGATTIDHYGRRIPKHAHGTTHFDQYTASTRCIVQAVDALFARIVDPALSVRRITVVAANVHTEAEASLHAQQTLFVAAEEHDRDAREKRLQESIIALKERYGKNALLKGMNLEDGATAINRNQQIGGHKA